MPSCFAIPSCRPFPRTPCRQTSTAGQGTLSCKLSLELSDEWKAQSLQQLKNADSFYGHASHKIAIWSFVEQTATTPDQGVCWLLPFACTAVVAAGGKSRSHRR